MTLTFYTNPMSRGRIARWMLEEIGAPYETVVLDYASSMKGDAYLAINPMGKVPAIHKRRASDNKPAATSQPVTETEAAEALRRENMDGDYLKLMSLRMAAL